MPCALPMPIIANAYAYRRLNLWNANCGASFEWVGRAIDPYLGFLTGWLMIAAYITGAVSGVEVLGPSVLAVFTSSTGSTGADIAIAAAPDGKGRGPAAGGPLLEPDQRVPAAPGRGRWPG